MDAICMILIAAGEEFKNIDRKTMIKDIENGVWP